MSEPRSKIDRGGVVERRGTQVVDWTGEADQMFGYDDGRVADIFQKFLETRPEEEATQAELQTSAEPRLQKLAKQFERSLQVRNAAATEWQAKGAVALAQELRRFVEVMRRIDAVSGLKRSERIECFLSEVGGKEHFERAFEAVQCAGCLHNVALMVAILDTLKQQGK